MTRTALSPTPLSIMAHLKPVLVSTLLFTLAACAPFSRKAVTPPPTLNEFNHWQLEAKLGIRTQTKAQSASVNWLQTGRDYHIQLFGPFGAGKVHIKKDGPLVTLREGSEYRTETSARKLFKHVSGLDLPIERLSIWITGRLSSNRKKRAQKETEVVYNEDGSLRSFKLQDWKIHYSRHVKLGDLTLPAKMMISSPRYKATFVIKQWRAVAK